MNESDDSDVSILDDIKALDEALALNARSNSQQHVSDDQSGNTSSTDVHSEDGNDDYDDYLDNNQCVDESLNALEINIRLVTGMQIAKKKLTALLRDCEQKIQLLDEKMATSMETNLRSKLTISNAGMPYFKDKDFYSVPKNYDTKLKESRGELFLPSLRKPSRWSAKDRETLLSAINNQAIESVLSGEFSKEIDEKSYAQDANTVVLPRNFNEMVGAVGEKEFDWYRISAMDFDNKHSPGECRAMWNVYLHPDFRKSEWTNEEDSKLVKCAREYKYQDWDAITRKLETNRSAYQCFIRYNTIKKVPSSGRAWSKLEDKHLMKVMSMIKIGDYIPWPEVANHIRHRTKQQIYTRWTYRKAPHLTKGRFTCAETRTLVEAVQKYGTNFCKISALLIKNRTSTQLQGRYSTIMNSGFNIWTLDGDMKLINLQRKYSNDWSRIATEFCDKTRTQVRHRYSALVKYIMKGVSLENIPRPHPITKKRKALTNKKLQYNNTCVCVGSRNLDRTASKNNIRTGSRRSNRKKRNKTEPNKLMQPTVSISDIQLRFHETLCFPPSIEPPNNPQEVFHSFRRLACDTKKLYDTLNLLNANLDIPYDFLDYVHLNNRDKQLLVSLTGHLNARDNGMVNEELEEVRTRMFGCAPEVSESDYFIPPLPFGGYIRTKKVRRRRNNTSIDCDLNFDEKFLLDMPAEFSICPCISPFVSTEEEIRFHRFGELIISDYHDCDQEDVDIYKFLKCILLFRKSSPNGTSSEYNELNMNIPKVYSEVNRRAERSCGSKETAIIKDEDDEDTPMSNIILPNQATLLGWKNLLLWKLLYDYENESRCESLASFEDERKPELTDSQPAQTEDVEYQLLRTRLLQLFKFPISLSNTIMKLNGPETIFSITKKKPDQKDTAATVSRKRKLDEYIIPEQLDLDGSPSVLTNSDSEVNSNVKTENVPKVRSCKVIRKTYKIIPKSA